MLKRLRSLFLLILVVFSLASCGQTQSTNKYSFKDITNQEISDVSRVLLNNGPMTSAQILFEGDYGKILDVDYVLSDKPYNEVGKILEDYRFWLHLEFDNTNEGINFYVLDYKLYYFNNETLYESLDKVNYNDFITSVPNGQYQVSIIDSGNYIIDELSHDAGMYTPGTILEFYSHPIMDVDLAMYVNDEFYDIQYSIRVDDGYMWKYTFVMPAENVVIKFEIHSIEYTDVRNVLNLPELSYKDIVEVRHERGYIGVAPGSLTNISYSADMEDKNMVLNLLEMTVYEDVGDNWQVTGGGYSLYSIITDNERYDIKITNGYISVNQKHYKFLGEYISFEYPYLEAHSFIAYSDSYEAYALDDVKIGNFTGISEYEFIEYPYDTIPENEDAGYIETEFGRLYIHSENIFYMKENNINTYYLVVGEKNFSDIFSGN